MALLELRQSSSVLMLSRLSLRGNPRKHSSRVFVHAVCSVKHANGKRQVQQTMQAIDATTDVMLYCSCSAYCINFAL